MSASREKKKRFDQKGEGTEKRQIRSRDEQAARKHSKTITAIVSAVVVVVVVFLFLFNSNLFYTGVPALSVGDHSFTAADVNFEYYTNYYNTYSNIANTYGDYAYLLLDPKKPLDEQNYSDTQTWDAFFEETARTQLQELAILGDLGEKDGFTLSEEQLAEIDSTVASLKSDAAQQGYPDNRAYLRALYGKGASEKRVRSLLEKSYYATYYSQSLSERWMDGYTDEEKDAYYETVHNDYDLLTYMQYYVSGAADEEAGIDAETAMAAAKEDADSIAAAAADQVSFAEAVRSFAPEADKANYADDDACLHRHIAPSNLSEGDIKSWLIDPARQTGETTVVAGDTGYTVLMFLETNDNRFRTANFRAVILPVEVDAELNTITDATIEQAETKLQEVLDSYEADATEENFIRLANFYNNANSGLVGGLHENVILGQLADRALEDYFFAGEPAEAGTVTSFYGDGVYYVVYAKEYGQPYRYLLAENKMAQEQYEELLAEQRGAYALEERFGYRFIK